MNESRLLPLSIEPLAFSMPLGAMVYYCEGQVEVGVEKSMEKELYSDWFQSRFNEFDDFLGTSLNGLEEQATNFSWLLKLSYFRGEMRGLFSSINYALHQQGIVVLVGIGLCLFPYEVEAIILEC